MNTPCPVHEILTREEIRALTQTSDRRAWQSVTTTWAIVFAALALAAWQPNVFGVGLALVLVGGRQLALAVLMHECSHRALFEGGALNRWAGRWLCGAPVWSDVDRYRVHHLSHHAHAGSDRDPDLSLATGFPITARSLIRKFARDLTGISGLRRVVGLLLMDAGYLNYSASDTVTRADTSNITLAGHFVRLVKYLTPTVVANAVLCLLLIALGIGWTYWVWVAAYFTTFSLFLRIRSMAEHACTDESADPLRHTRTTYASWAARLTVAPHDVNFHTEHHLLPTVPHYNLEKMHAILKQRGAFEGAHLSSGYGDVLATMVGAGGS